MPKRDSPQFHTLGWHATFRHLTTAEKNRLGFRKEKEVLARRSVFRDARIPYSTGLAAAYFFYPKHFPKVLALSSDKKIVYTERLILDEDSQAGIKAFYKSDPGPEFYEYERSISQPAHELAEKIYKESGIEVNDHVANVGVITENGRKRFVFFEPKNIYLDKFEARISAITDKRKRKEAEFYLSDLKKFAIDGVVRVHPYEVDEPERF